jgi:hypothetical protein
MNIDHNVLLQNLTPGYLPSSGSVLLANLRNRPLFTRQMVREMIQDPRVAYGLYLIKGPITSNSKFEIDCEASEIKEYLSVALERFWRNSASRALKAIEWGFSGSEVMYRMKDGRIHFDVIKDLDPSDVAPVRLHGKIIGIHVHNNRYDRDQSYVNGQNLTYLGGPKALWHVHCRERSPWWGVSRLFGAHIPYWEKWSEGGFRDIRRLWFHKNAFQGGTMYHPPGSTYDDQGLPRSNKDLAREMMEKMRSGGTLTLPNTPGGEGNMRAWEYIPPIANPTPEGMLEYGRDIDTEILEAMGIPPEVIESGGDQGFGSSTGRQVPQEAFYAILNELIQWLITDFDNQVLRPLVALNFGEEYDYDIYPVPLGESPMEEEMPGESTGENQFIEEDGDAKDQDQIDQEEADRYEKSRSKSLKSFQMAAPATTERKPLTGGSWITIGGRPVGDKKHKGGFPVYVSEDGTILAGGPRNLKGQKVSDAGSKLNREDRQSRAKTTPNHRTPYHNKYQLPDPNTELGVALRDNAGDDPEDQHAFHNLLKQVHEEHKASVAKNKAQRSSNPDYNKKFYSGADLSKAPDKIKAAGLEPSEEMTQVLEANAHKIKGANDDLGRLFRSAAKLKDRAINKPTFKTVVDSSGKKSKVMEELPSDAAFVAAVLTKRVKRDQARSWTSVSKNLADTLGMDKKQVDSIADDLYERTKKEYKNREDVKAYIRKVYNTNSAKQTKAEDRSIEDSGILSERLGNLDVDIVRSVGFETAPSDNPHDPKPIVVQSEANASLARELVAEGKQRVPGKIDDDFLGMLFDELTGGDAIEKDIVHQDILDEAQSRWHKTTAKDDVSFDFGANEKEEEYDSSGEPF